MRVREARVEDAPAMGRVMVETFLAAHRGQMPDEAWKKRQAEWTPEVSAEAWQRALTALRCSGDTEPGDARPLLPFGRRVTHWDELGGFGLEAGPAVRAPRSTSSGSTV